MNKIVFPLKRDMKSPEVGDLHDAIGLLGLDVAEAETSHQGFGPTTEAAVRKFQAEHQLRTTGIVDEATANSLNRQLERLAQEGSPGRTAGFVVEGRVLSDVRAGVGGLRVEIVDKNVGLDKRIKHATTDPDGRYRVGFTAAEAGKARPDLQAQAYRGDRLLAMSEIRYNASPREVLNVVVPAAAASALPSEYETLTGALSAHFKGNLRDLQETEDRQDIAYLANKSGWDARAVALAALADQFSERAGGAIEPVFFYALFRAGLPADENLLYRADAGTLELAWKKAAEEGVLPAARLREVPERLKRFHVLSAHNLLSAPALAGVSSLKDMLGVSRLEEAKQKEFAELYVTHRADLPAFWRAVARAFGQDVAERLQVDGKLGFLTINNAPLMRKVHQAAGNGGMHDPLRLAQLGYHRPERWNELLTPEVAVPEEIPGDTAKEQRANYAAYLAAQVRLSYPTAAVAEMVQREKLTGAHSDDVHAFLTAHQGKFEIGMQPVEQYVARNKIQVTAPTLTQVKRVQRVYQITPSDQALTGLLKRDIDAAYHVVRHSREAFVQSFAQDLGGAEHAEQTYDKSMQVHNAVLNVVVSYLTARNAPGIGVHSPAQIVEPAPTPPANVADVIAYSTLEDLFSEMDYCACDHCRSILSPAAYLVDLLNFIDAPPTEAGSKNPQAVLLERRPDLQHLPLTCENTNTALPYIDVVNETLEYFIANDAQPFSLTNYAGHDTAGAVSEDLLASPQYVVDAAYTRLRDARFPAPLPFHKPLEQLRRYFEKFEVPLALAMERLRKTNDLERGANPYGWRDILMEEIGLSRAEHEILTDSAAVPLWRLYGFPNGTSDQDAIAALSKVKDFCRRLDLSYEDVVAMLRTRFVNPQSALVPKLERLGVPFAALKALKDAPGNTGDAAFDALLPTGAAAPDPQEYDGDIKAWVKNNANYANIMVLITLSDPNASLDTCRFDTLEFRHAQPMANPQDTTTRLSAPEFVRLGRFIRLWKKTAWTLDQTDAAICALFRADLAPLGAGDVDTVAKLDAGFLTLLPRLGVVARVLCRLGLSPKRDLVALLACWAPIDTHDGLEWFIDKDQSRRLRRVPSLYRQLFLNPALPVPDAAFADDGYGVFLQRVEVAYAHPQPTLALAIVNTGQGRIGYRDSTQRLFYVGVIDVATRDALKAVAGVSAAFQQAVDALYGAQRLANHAETLRSAFNLTADEYEQIIAALGYDAGTVLTLSNVSAIFRRGWLARKLKLSVRELLLLIEITGLDPFAMPDPTDPALWRLIALLQALRDRSLPTEAALYLVWNQDLSGKSAPAPATLAELARTLRSDFVATDESFATTEAGGGEQAVARMALVYGPQTSDAFFALLDETQVVDVGYTHPAPVLENAITAVDAKLKYDHFLHRLSYTGLLTAAKRDALKLVAGVPNDFQTAVQALYDRGEEIKGRFFTRYPELLAPYTVASAAAPADRHAAFLGAFQPELARRRKRQQALQRLSLAATVDLEYTQALLYAAGAPHPLHAAADANQPALADVLALETAGLSVEFFFRDTATGAVDLSVAAAAELDYAAPANPLPANTAVAGNPISGIWRGQLEAPEAGYYNLVIEADAAATLKLELDGRTQSLTRHGSVWRNSQPLELKAGALYELVLTAEKIKDTLRVQWETPQRARETISARYLYPPTVFAPFANAYVRFLKAVALAAALKLDAAELAHFATRTEYQINADGWLNALAVTGAPSAATARALLGPLCTLLDYARVKAEIAPGDLRLLAALKDPIAASADPHGLLYTLTRWEAGSLDALLIHFGKVNGANADRVALRDLATFMRVHDAFAPLRTMGISASALIAAVGNEPSADSARALQVALRARYDASVWRDLVQPINDALRGRQRDALVAYILHQMRSNPASAHIDTIDKLFEYFLMDVAMEPCMQTSRIRHALSTVQLFIERCLMNLERNVSAAAINAKQWEWMKRYRVWEANRKVFLFPENWLEPELRDDKSVFFKEIESELLQSDITEDSAASALLNYLAKLEEVAKLEPCGIEHLEADPAKRIGEVDHVVARTAGAHRKYYYRRREGGAWTPWEPIKLDIEDNPALPYVWNGRLLLFWLRLLKQPPLEFEKPGSAVGQSLTSLSTTDIKTDATNLTVQAVLCYSEYYNGKWQPPKTSDPNRPVNVDTSPAGGAEAFDRGQLQLSVVAGNVKVKRTKKTGKKPTTKTPKDALCLSVDYQGSSRATFLLYNTHSLPQPAKALPHVLERALQTADSDTFHITYTASPSDLERAVVKNTLADGTVETYRPLKKAFDAPFFYEDRRHVFYVTTTQEPKWIGSHFDIGVTTKPGIQVEVKIPPLVFVETHKPPKPIPEYWGTDNKPPIVKGPGTIDPVPSMRRFVTEDAYISRGLGTVASVPYGDSDVGPKGLIRDISAGQ